MITNMTQSESYRITIIHGWADDPTKGWINWLVGELRTRGYEAQAPRLPKSKLEHTDFTEWQDAIAGAIGDPASRDIIVAHSMGVPMVLRYLSDYPGALKLAGLIFVAGVVDHPYMRPNPLFDPPFNLEKIMSVASVRISIYSDNDHAIPLQMTDQLAARLKMEKVLDSGKEHFAGLHGCSELPSVLNAIESIALSDKR